MTFPSSAGAFRAMLAVSALSLVACTSATTATDATPTSTTSASGTTVAPGTSSTSAPPVRSSAGCGKEPRTAPTVAPPGDVALTFPHGAGERTYRLGVPASYDKSTPASLILNLHGSGSNAAQQTIYSDLPQRAAKRGAITVAPDAIANKWELTAEGPDKEFLAALIDDIEGAYCVDLDRVHVIGLSLGAWKAALTACVEHDRYASAVLVTVEVHPPNCAPVAALAFHGTADPVVPYGEGADPGIVNRGGGNANLPGARSNIASWAKAAGCSAEQREEKIGDDVVRWIYPDCQPGFDVELYTILHGAHTWPGSAVTVGATTKTIDATELALDWFDAHPKRQ